MTKNEQSKLINLILLKTARTFYLTLKAMPKPIRKPLSIAYLLARSSDTVADVEGLPNEQLLFILDVFKDIINSGPDKSKIEQLEPCLSYYPSESKDHFILSHFGLFVEWMYALDNLSLEKIKSVLNKIIEGQREDIIRFRLNMQLSCLETIEEMDRYTYAVAGCVGEFWTDLCLNKIPPYSNLSRDVLFDYAISFGKGLQLINIIRDLPEDIAQGRCYIPREQLDQYQLELGDIQKNLNKLQPIINYWIEKAIDGLGEGWVYMISLKNRRIKAALALQLLTGFSTLYKLKNEHYLTKNQPLKISHKEFRYLRLIALLSIMTDKAFSLTRFLACAHLIPHSD